MSTALFLAVGVGIFEALALYFGSGVFLNLMGVSFVSFSSFWLMSFLASCIRTLFSIGAHAPDFTSQEESCAIFYFIFH